MMTSHVKRQTHVIGEGGIPLSPRRNPTTRTMARRTSTATSSSSSSSSLLLARRARRRFWIALLAFIIFCANLVLPVQGFHPPHAQQQLRRSQDRRHGYAEISAATTFRDSQRNNPHSSPSSTTSTFTHLQMASFFAAEVTDPVRVARESLFTQVVSDVDDTLKSSGGVNIGGVALGGIDVQYARGDVYPGVEQFMLQLSLDNRCHAQSTTPPPPKIAILTARAEEFKAALELKESSSLAQAFIKAGQAEGIDGWGIGPVLYGSVAEWIVQDRKGLRKFTNFERLLNQDPSGRVMKYIYVGDTGELDQEAGETMLRDYAPYVRAVFLHTVSDAPGGNVPVPPPKYTNGRPLVFFRTYVGAAVAAVQLDLMTPAGLQKVIQSATQRLEAAGVPRDSDKWTDLQQDIDLAQPFLK